MLRACMFISFLMAGVPLGGGPAPAAPPPDSLILSAPPRGGARPEHYACSRGARARGGRRGLHGGWRAGAWGGTKRGGVELGPRFSARRWRTARMGMEAAALWLRRRSPRAKASD